MKEIKVPFLGCNEFALSVGCNDFVLGVVMIILFYIRIKSESGAAPYHLYILTYLVCYSQYMSEF